MMVMKKVVIPAKLVPEGIGERESSDTTINLARLPNP